MARMVLPEEYDLIGIVDMCTMVMLGMVDGVFSYSLIRKNATNMDYNVLLIFNLAVSVVMFGISK